MEEDKGGIGMNQYTIYCTEEQTKKAFKLGAPLELWLNDYDAFDVNYIELDAETKDGYKYAVVPTAEQMIEWLDENGLHISVIYDDCTYKPEVRDIHDGFINNNEYLNSRKEASLTAINVALNYLITDKNYHGTKKSII